MYRMIGSVMGKHEAKTKWGNIKQKQNGETKPNGKT
jgi:hypothetical protein